MSQIDWTSPQIVAAVIAGVLALAGTVLAAVFIRSRVKKTDDSQRQVTAFSKDIDQKQAGRDLVIGRSDDKSAG